MDKEKEIEKMAHCIGATNFLCAEDCNDCIQTRDKCKLVKYAETLYNAGYRKAEDVKREAIKEFAERLEAKAVESCDIYTCGMVVTIGDIRELVKEYLG